MTILQKYKQVSKFDLLLATPYLLLATPYLLLATPYLLLVTFSR